MQELQPALLFEETADYDARSTPTPNRSGGLCAMVAAKYDL
jgi:hypothetical protein